MGITGATLAITTAIATTAAIRTTVIAIGPRTTAFTAGCRCIVIVAMLPKNLLQTKRSLIDTFVIPIAAGWRWEQRGIC